MVLVVKGNTEFTIPEEKIEEYINMGYSLIDNDGTVIRTGRPKTADDFNHVISELTAEVKKLTADNRVLTEENKKLKAAQKSKTRKKTAKSEG